MSNRFVRPALACVMSVGVCALSGCTTETHDGDTVVFAFAWWTPVVVLLGGIVGFVFGLVLRSKTTRWSWVLLIGGAAACLIFVPSLVLDKVTLTKEGFTQRTGLWFAPQVHNITFANLSQIELISETSRRSKSYSMVCHRRAGGSERVPINDLMKEGAAASILDAAEQHGIRVIDKMDQ